MKKSSLIIGRQPLIEAMMAGQAIDKILMQKNISGDTIGEIRKMAREKNIPIQIVPPEKLNAMVKANHQGVIGQGALIQYYDLQQVIDFLNENTCERFARICRQGADNLIGQCRP